MNNIDGKKGYLMVFISGVLWGSIGLFVKLLKNMDVSSEMISFTRMLTAFILILIFGLVTEGVNVLKIGKKTLLCCMIMGLLCQAVYNFAYTEAIDHVGMSMGAVLLYTAPVFTAIFARVVYKEGFSAIKVSALIINILGCILAVTGGSFGVGNFSMYGVLMGILAAVMYALSPIIGRFAAAKEGPVTIAIYMFIFASIFLAAFTKPWTGLDNIISAEFLITGGLYGLIPTVTAYILYFNGLAGITESGKVPVFASVETVVAAIIGISVFNENVNVWKIIGIIMVMLSIYIMNIKSEQKIN